MTNKKLMMSVTATAAIASAFFATDKAEASSYKVQSGDTLWSIAQKHKTSVSQLKTLNKLSSDVIYVNQVLQTSSTQASNSTNTKPEGSNSNTNNQSASTYTVKAGDTLSSIAGKHNISLSNLMKWNNLTTTLIYPGNVLVVNGASASNTGNTSNSNSGSTDTSANQNTGSSGSTYVVKSGDTLFRIASNHGVSVANLKQWNNLSSDTIYIGQKLSINGKSNSNNNGSSNTKPETTPPSNTEYSVNQLVSAAKSVIGTPYVWAGTTTSGFDCSGFIYYAYSKAGMNISRLSTDGYFNRSYYVNSPQVGDLVFFENTYKSGISHMGIYIGNNQFIHAGSSTGVTIASLSNSYWKKHYHGYKRFY